MHGSTPHDAPRRSLCVLTILVGFSWLLSGCSGPLVTRVDPDLLGNPGRLSDEGIFYALPRTVIDVEIPVRRLVVRPSPFLQDLEMAAEELRAHYSDANVLASVPEEMVDPLIRQMEDPLSDPRYQKLLFRLNQLGLTPMQEIEETRFSLGSARLSTRSEADPNQIYFVDARGGFFSDQTLALGFTESGFLSSAELEIEDKTVDLTIKAIEVAADIARVTALGKWDITSPEDNPVSKILGYGSKILDDLEDVRARRLTLATGQGGSDGGNDFTAKTLDRMIEELSAQERSLRSYFRSSELHEWTARASLVPDSAPEARTEVPIFTFDPAHGLEEALSPSEGRAPSIPEEFRATDGGDPIVVTLTSPRVGDDEISPAEIIAARAARDSEQGFPYRIPASLVVTVSWAGNDLLQGTIPVAQRGALAFLPEDTGSPNTRFDLSFYADSGSLRTVRIVSTGLEPSDFDRLGNAVVPLLEDNEEIKDRLEEIENQIEDELDSSD